MTVTLAFCVDDRGGLSFNRRRQSRDRAVSADLLSQAGECTLWVEPCSRPLFPEEAEHIRTAEEPWTQAGPEDLCFLELTGPAPALERADQLILYRWNRHYPSDRKIALPPEGWTLTGRTEFPGYSHDVITKEIYQR